MFYVLCLYASFEFHSDLTIVFRSFDYLRSASFTAFRKWITYLIYFSLSKIENDLQFSINLSMIKVLPRSSKSELSKNWTIVTGELTLKIVNFRYAMNIRTFIQWTQMKTNGGVIAVKIQFFRRWLKGRYRLVSRDRSK